MNMLNRIPVIFSGDKIILAFAFCLISSFSYPQDHSPKYAKLIVHLLHAPFRSLALLDYRQFHDVLINGNLIDTFKWEFVIPDSIAANSENMMLIVPQKDTVANAYREVRFIRKFKNKKIVIANLGIEGDSTYIEGEYTGKTLFENENVGYFLGKTDSIINGNFICDDFKLTVKNDSSDITLRSIDPYYAWFDAGNNKLSYDDNLKFYVKLAEDYPNSRYLIRSLSLNLSMFKSRQDVKKIYEKFSGKQKNSKWSARIDRFLSDDFHNISLINLTSQKIEPLVQDFSKYNLIIFSAAWCAPCKEEIPLLKELYKNLKSRFNFTFVSMDYEKGIKSFQDILIQHNIPWRSLYAYKDREKVMDLFSIRSIPLSLLFYPDGRIERMDVRDKGNQQKLYALRF